MIKSIVTQFTVFKSLCWLLPKGENPYEEDMKRDSQAREVG